MPLPSHWSWTIIFFRIIAWLLKIKYGFSDLLVVIVAAGAPDYDFFFYFFNKKKEPDSAFQHHNWPSHWPIFYSPLIIVCLIYPSLKTLIICCSCFFHLVLDSFFTDGIMWFAPVWKKKFVFLGKKRKSLSVLKGFKDYCSLWIFKLDIVSYILFFLIMFFSL